MGDEHPLIPLLKGLGAGRFPAGDGTVEVFPGPPGPVDGVLAFFAHFVVAADVEAEWVRAQLPPGDYIAPLGHRFISAMSERLGAEAGNLDLVFVAPPGSGVPEIDLVELSPEMDHPRVARSRRWRTDIRVYGTPDGEGLLIVGRGLACRWEAAFEVQPGSRNRGLGRALCAAARGLIPSGETLFLQVAPGNVASVRAILATGAKPIGAEVLFTRSRG